MSDRPEKHEKQFDATPRRIEKAREEGNVFRSRELIAVGMLAVGFGTFLAGAPAAFRSFGELMGEIFLASGAVNITHDFVPLLMRVTGYKAFLVILPLFVMLTVTALGLNILQSGWNLTAKPLAPKASRISPSQGIKRIFSAKGVFELFKGIVKIATVAPFVYATITRNIDQIVALPGLAIPDILTTGMYWIVVLLAKMLAVLAALTIIDVSFEKWRYKNDLKMTSKEVRDEVKDSEGDPHVRSRRRREALKLRDRPRLLDAVLKSDVVVTNPTHYAVGLAYDPEENAAPRLVIKGIRKRALLIREMALEHDVPVMENPPLARALYKTVAEDSEIPPEMYTAVAALLAEVYRQREQRNYN